MNDICSIVGIGCVALGIITVVGHLIWIALAAIVRTASGSTPPARSRSLDERTLALRLVARLYGERRISTATYREMTSALGLHPPEPIVESQPKPQPADLGFPAAEPLPRPQVPRLAVEPPPLPVRPIPIAPEPLRAQPVEPPTPPRPRRSLAEVLSAFMHDSNIRWGELVGALLIIGCSIALVRTFWDTIREYDWLRFFVLNSTTVAVFATGLYTERKWKLPATSRGLLLTATLLVPLNFLAMSFAHSGDLLTLAGEVASIGVFGLLLYLSSTILTGGFPLSTTLCILGISATQLLVNRIGPTASLAASAVALFVAAPAQALWTKRKSALDAPAFLTLLGTAALAIVIALGLFLYRRANPLASLHTLAPLLSLLSLPVMAVGIALARTLHAPADRPWRIAATAVALFGGAVLTTFLVLAWPTSLATAMLLAYAVLALVIAWRTGAAPLAWAGLALALVASLRLFVYPAHLLDARAWTVSLLVYATAATLLAAAGRLVARTWPSLSSPLLVAPLLASLATLPAFAFTLFPPDFAWLWPMLLWLSGVELALAMLLPSRKLYVLFQAVLTLCAMASAMVIVRLPFTIHDPRILQAMGIAAGLVSLAWPVVRITRSRHPGLLQSIIQERPASLDAFLSPILLAVGAILLAWSLSPGIRTELSTTSLTFPATPASLAAGAIGTVGVLAALALLITLQLVERPSRWFMALALLSTATLPALAAARYPAAAASAWRWCSAVYLLISAAVLLRRRQGDSTGLLDGRALTLATGLLPILILTLNPAAAMLAGQTIHGPAAGCFFQRVGSAANYLLPLAMATLVLLAYAVRLASPGFALSASLMLNLSLSLGYALALTTAGIRIDLPHAMRLLHVNTISFAFFALAWVWIVRRRQASVPACLKTLGILAGIAFLLVLAPAEANLLVSPRHLAPFNAAGSVGWIAFAACVVMAVALMRAARKGIPAGLICAMLLSAGSMMALWAASRGGYVALHVLLASRALSAWIILGLGFLATARFSLVEGPAIDVLEGQTDQGPLARLLGWVNFRQPITGYVLLCCSLVLALGFLLLGGDPARPDWSIYVLAAAVSIFIALSIWTLRSACLYGAGLACMLAVNIWFFGSRHPGIDVIQLNLLALSATGLGTLLLELLVLRPLRGDVVRISRAGYHRLATLAALGGWFAITSFNAILELLPFASGSRIDLLAITTAAMVCIACIARLWDIDARRIMPELYLLGLSLTIFLLHALLAYIPLRPWHPLGMLAGFSLLVSYLYAIRQSLGIRAESLGIPLRSGWPGSSPRWLTPITSLLATLICASAFLIVLNADDLDDRLVSAACAVAAALSVALLGKDPASHMLKQVGLALLAATAILWGWAWLDPASTTRQLDLLAITMTALGAMSAAYSIGMTRIFKLTGPWRDAARSVAPLLAIATGASLLAMLITELLHYQARGLVTISPPAIIAAAAALAALVAGCLCAALLDEHNVLRLSPATRTAYVYAAEAILVLFFLHLRLCVPELFANRLFERFWPVIILVLAFGAVGLSEFLRRNQRLVLSEPLANTGIFLPLLPILGFFATSEARLHMDYALVLVLAGLVYASLAMVRRSFVLGVMAALAGNGALWRILAIEEFRFTLHPQFYLIPAALSVMLAGWIHRAQLSADAQKQIRRICLAIIYVSSTCDIMLNGVQEAPYLPLILAALSAAGVLGGIALRIQSFLFLGATFLLVSLFTLVFYASRQVQSIWPLLVAGIVVGIAIVVLFALFEKRRPQLLALVDGLREWQG